MVASRLVGQASDSKYLKYLITQFIFSSYIMCEFSHHLLCCCVQVRAVAEALMADVRVTLDALDAEANTFEVTGHVGPSPQVGSLR